MLFVFSISAQAQKAKKKSRRKAKIEVVDVYPEKEKKLNEMYDEYLLKVESNDTTASALSQALLTEFSSLSEKDKKRFEEKLVSDAVAAFENEEDKDNEAFLKQAQKAVFMLPEDNTSRFALLGSVAEVYVQKRELEKLEETIQIMHASSISQLPENEGTLKELTDKATEIRDMDKQLEGNWVSDIDDSVFKKNSLNLPFLMIHVNELKDASIKRESRILSEKDIEWYYFMHSERFDFNRRNGTFLFEFYNRYVHRGDAALANDLLNNAQTTQSRIQASIRANKPKAGEAALATGVGVLYSGLVTGLAFSFANSSVDDKSIVLSGSIISPNCLSITFDYKHDRVDTYTNYPHTKDRLIKDMRLWRWESDQNIIFSDKKCKPISPYVRKLTPGMELYDIHKKYNAWTSPLGIVKNLSFVAGCLMLFSGKPIIAPLILCASIPLATNSIRLSRRAKEVKAYNKRMYEQMKSYHEDD